MSSALKTIAKTLGFAWFMASIYGANLFFEIMSGGR